MKVAKRLIKSNTLEVTGVCYVNIFRFELDSLAPGETSDVIELPVNTIKGALGEVKFQSESDNVDIALLTHPTASVQSIDCLYSKTGINIYSVALGLLVYWARFSHKDITTGNRSMADSLYFTYKNNGTVPTGETVIELAIQVHMF